MAIVFNLNNQPILEMKKNVIANFEGKIIGYLDQDYIKNLQKKELVKITAGKIINAFTNENIASIINDNIVNINKQVIGKVKGKSEL
ncbi:MAG: hypothetical protein HRT68_11500, partial [Flavobacteriaceae bacterium]|nr:hypothetical protein [Flavobacteriaceae bacterium]